MRKHYINDQIKASEVQLILETGKVYGKISLVEALKKTYDMNLDLVQISKKGNIPICKLMDYGKLKYKESKKKSNRKERIKEIRISLNIGEHDLKVKNKKVMSILSSHKKVKYVLELKGREINRIEEAKKKMLDILEEFKEKSKWEDFKISKNNSFCRIITILNSI